MKTQRLAKLVSLTVSTVIIRLCFADVNAVVE
jgi:hypothetical protein